MRIQFHYIYEDFARSRRKKARRWNSERQSTHAVALAFLWLAAGVLMVMGAGIYLAITVTSGWLCASVIPLLLLIFVVKAMLSEPRNGFGSRKKWDSDPLSHSAVEVELTPTGFRFASPQWRSFVEWRAVKGIFENEHGFWISLGHNSYVVPKRIFASADALAEFSTLLAAYSAAQVPRNNGSVPSSA